MIFCGRGQSTGRQDLVRGVGMGSRRHVVGLEFVTSSDTNCSSTAEKAEKQLKGKGQGVVKALS